MKIELPRDVKHDGRMCIAVFGGRDFSDENLLFEALDTALMQCERRDLRLLIVQGGATGADALARDWAEYQDGAVDLATENANWKLHGKAAGPKRNQLMIDKYQPDYFIAVSGATGTADMSRRCHAAGIPGIVYRGIDFTTWPQTGIGR